MTRTSLLLVVLMLSPTVGRAQDDATRATALGLVREGSKLLERNDFQAALDKFNQAYALVHSPKQLFNQGLALRGLGRNVEAVQAVERFLAEAKDASAEHRDKARGKIAELTALVGQVEIRCNRSGAAVTMDSQALAATPLPGPVWVEPGNHQVSLKWEGEKKSTPFTATAGKMSLVSFDFEEEPPAPVVEGRNSLPPPVVAPVVSPATTAQEPAPAQRSLLRSTWLWVGVGAVVAVVGTGLILIYGSHDRYPSTGLGTQSIGGAP
jgi:tetratricopeptide (TPR) repeat protein